MATKSKWDLKQGTRVTWMQPNQMVPHPDNKIHPRYGEIKVMRPLRMFGVIDSTNVSGYTIKPDGRPYNMNVKWEIVEDEKQWAKKGLK